MKPPPAVPATTFLIGLFFLAVLVSGCGRKERPTIPVQGEVVYTDRNGAKVSPEGAMLTFYLQDDPNPLPLHPTARVEKDGTFQVSTYATNDGLPEGEYRVTASWQDFKVVMGQEQPKGPDKLKNKYGDPNTTPLRATVKKGMASLRYELQ